MTTVAARRPARSAATARVRRASHRTGPLGLLALAVVVVFAFMPEITSQADMATLVDFFILLTMSTMWNLLAGYAGMVSIGQQAFIGLGAYTVLTFALNGVNPVAAIPLAAIVCAVIALPVSLLVFRLRGGYFAIATWVVADTANLVISSISQLGGGTGHAVPGLSHLSPTSFGDTVYWSSLIVVVLAIATAYLVMRSRLGLVLSAVRDNEIGVRSAGARVTRARRTVFLIAGAGCGLAGALLAISALNVQPASGVFNVQWSAEMIFTTMIGGIGTIEGPILGSVIFFVLQQNLAQQGAWYLIIFGSVAIVIAIWSPQGLWGALNRKLPFHFFPVGYYVDFSGTARRGFALPSLPWRKAQASGSG